MEAQKVSFGVQNRSEERQNSFQEASKSTKNGPKSETAGKPQKAKIIQKCKNKISYFKNSIDEKKILPKKKWGIQEL